MITREREKNLEAQVQAQAKLLAVRASALKLARAAILRLCGGYPLHYSKNYGFREANEALAAIDALGE